MELIVTEHAWQRWIERFDPDVTIEKIVDCLQKTKPVDPEKIGKLGAKPCEGKHYLRHRKLIAVVKFEDDKCVLLTVLRRLTKKKTV